MSEQESSVDEWREWVREIASEYGLEAECLGCFEQFLKNGDHPSIAAQHALWEWDI